jgi:hypothetical protein
MVKHHRGHRICMALYLVTYQHQRRLVGIVIVSAGSLEEARLHSAPELGEASLDKVLSLDDEIAAGVPSHFVVSRRPTYSIGSPAAPGRSSQGCCPSGRRLFIPRVASRPASVIIAHAAGTDRSVPEQDHLCRLSRKAARRKLTGVSRRGSGAGPVLMADGRGSNRTLSARATTRLRNAFDRSRLAFTIGAAFLAADSRETRHAPASAGSVRPIAKGGRTATVR